jgi:colanic acid biosynthesis glycosyl transferase WcaI
MRLLFIVQNYPPERGPVRYTSGLAEGMATRGHDVRVITGLPHYPEGKPHAGFGAWRPQTRVENGVEVVRVPLVVASNTQLARRVVGMATFGATALPSSLMGPRPDVIIASVPPVPVAMLGVAAATTHNAPLVMLLRDVEPKISFELRGIADRPWARAAIRASARLYDQADHLVVVHESQERSLTDHGVAAGKVETIRHGIDIERFQQLADRGTASLPRRAGRKVLLYMGTMGVAHDVDVLVKAFDHPDVRRLPIDLVLIGGGELTGAIDAVIRDRKMENARLLPAVALEQVPGLLSSADALVTSYRTMDADIAGMIGSKLYEYCAAAKPILVHGTGVAADLVEQVGNGWRSAPGDVPALVRALTTMLDSPERATEMGLRGQAYARANFSLRSRHDRWEQLLGRLASSPVGAPAPRAIA